MKFENKCECSTTTHGHEDVVDLLKDFYNPCNECGKENEIKFVHFTDKKVGK